VEQRFDGRSFIKGSRIGSVIKQCTAVS